MSLTLERFCLCHVTLVENTGSRTKLRRKFIRRLFSHNFISTN